MERLEKIAFSARQNSENEHMRYQNSINVSLNFELSKNYSYTSH